MKLKYSKYIFLILFIGAVGAQPLLAAKPEFFTDWKGFALRGYDAVAYQKTGSAVKGNDKYIFKWKNAKWKFSSSENLSLFKSNPEKYAPRYGGYCAWAVANGYTASTDPEAFRIVDGKLYLNYNKSVQRTWERDIPGNIKRADRNWPGVLK